MTAPISKQLFICDHACTCAGPSFCDHRRPHEHVFSDYNGPDAPCAYCDNCFSKCFFVAVPVGCIPFQPQARRTINEPNSEPAVQGEKQCRA